MGHVAGFFVVAVRRGEPVADPHAHAPTSLPGSLSRHEYVALWSRFHNVDYSAIDKVRAAAAQWREDLVDAIERAGGAATDYVTQAAVEPAPETKRKAEEPPAAATVQPTMLQPRKKVKKV